MGAEEEAPAWDLVVDEIIFVIFPFFIGCTGRPLSGQLQPHQSRTDMLSWSRYEAGQYSLDWQACILYELDGMSQEAEGLGIAPGGLLGQVGTGCIHLPMIP